MKDVAYLLSSCLDSDECEVLAAGYLDHYFASLRAALAEAGSSIDMNALEAEWRGLYPVAWADFYRFLVGWAPDHYKIHGYSAEMLRQAMAG